MANLTTRELRRFEWISGVLVLLGIAILLLTRIPYEEHWFWADYIEAFYGWGWIAIVIGLFCGVLSLIRGRTRFFDVDSGLAPDMMAISVVSIMILTAVACAVAVALLPRTEPEKLPLDQVKRAAVLALERNTRLYVAAVVIVMGVCFASFPVIRHMRNPGKARRGKGQ